jgi:hypothetical protein
MKSPFLDPETRRRKEMKLNGVRAFFGFILLAAQLGTSTTASANETCSNARAAGEWGFTLAGTLLLPSGPVLGAAVGTLTVDELGNIAGAESRNVGGGFAKETITGSWTVNPDCTASMTVNIYESGVLVRTSVLDLVFVNNSSHVRGVQQSLALPDGTPVPVVITVEGDKLFTGNGD